jgi:hypothetical protein
MPEVATDQPTASTDPNYTTTDNTALAAANAAGVKSPSTISDTQTGMTPDELHNRLQVLEALVDHILALNHRNTDKESIVKTWLENRKGSPVLDETAKGRA